LLSLSFKTLALIAYNRVKKGPKREKNNNEILAPKYLRFLIISEPIQGYL